MAILLGGGISALEFLRHAAQVWLAMKLHLSRQQSEHAARPVPAAPDTHDRPATPVASDVICEVGLLLAVHLGVVFAIVSTLHGAGIE